MKKVYCFLIIIVSTVLFNGCTLMQMSAIDDMGYRTARYTSPEPPDLTFPSIKWLNIFKTQSFELKINTGNLFRSVYPALTGKTVEEPETPTPAIMGQIRF